MVGKFDHFIWTCNKTMTVIISSAWRAKVVKQLWRKTIGKLQPAVTSTPLISDHQGRTISIKILLYIFFTCFWHWKAAISKTFDIYAAICSLFLSIGGLFHTRQSDKVQDCNFNRISAKTSMVFCGKVKILHLILERMWRWKQFLISQLEWVINLH